MCKKRRRPLKNSSALWSIKNSSSIEIQFKNNWICNEILNNVLALTLACVQCCATTCWIFHQISALSVHFSHGFSHNWRILSLNYAMNVKICHQMHKLARKSDELIPPAQHQLQRYWINLFSLSLSHTRVYIREFKKRENVLKRYMLRCYVLAAIKSLVLSRFCCERSIIVIENFILHRMHTQ
jgi:hypothetical protein